MPHRPPKIINIFMMQPPPSKTGDDKESLLEKALKQKREEETLLTLKQAVSEIRRLPHTAHAGGGACDV
jgi:hypothetical protein